MELKTNRQVAEKLKSVASRLDCDGDAPADQRLIDAVASLEWFAASPQKRGTVEHPIGENHAELNVAVGSSWDLAKVVEEIKSARSTGRPLSEQFRNEVLNHDRTRCVASLVFEDLWNGFDGWKSSQFFWDVVIFVWRNAPDFFGEYDPDREIVEDPSRWTQRYFDEQRNYLRHNFCLKRLCHLVMVYKYLHGAEADERKTPPTQPPSPVRSHVKDPQHYKQRCLNNRWGGYAIGCLILVAGLLTYWGMSHRGKSPGVEASQGSEISTVTAIQLAAESVSKKSPEHQVKTETEVDISKGAADLAAHSNKVVKRTIALQPVTTKANKAPIRRTTDTAIQD